jgi:hypothetical protein
MNEKASNLEGRIATGGNEPASASFLRRKSPALSFCLILLAFLAALTLQTLRMLELRRESAALRAATAGLDQLRQDNADLERLRAAAQQAGRAQKEQEELEKLRAEVDQLRAVAQELPALRAESQRLAAERAEAAARAGVVAEVDPFAEEQKHAQRINCISNIKQICLAARVWANDHQEILPTDFLTMSNELATPKILTCSADTARTRANDWREFDGRSVSYELLSPGVEEARNADVVFVRCPICNNVGLVDGSAHQLGPGQRVEKVDGKFKIIRVNLPSNSPQP